MPQCYDRNKPKSFFNQFPKILQMFLFIFFQSCRKIFLSMCLLYYTVCSHFIIQCNKNNIAGFFVYAFILSPPVLRGVSI